MISWHRTSSSVRNVDQQRTKRNGCEAEEPVENYHYEGKLDQQATDRCWPLLGVRELPPEEVVDVEGGEDGVHASRHRAHGVEKGRPDVPLLHQHVFGILLAVTQAGSADVANCLLVIASGARHVVLVAGNAARNRNVTGSWIYG